MRIFLCALLVCCWSAGVQAQDRVRISYASRSIVSILPFIALDKGFFKEEALEPQLILTRGTTAIAAAVAGDVEVIHIMGSAIRGIIQGLPMKVLAVYNQRPLFWLATRPELKSFADLKGKTMAVTTIGGSQQLAGNHMLRKGGIDPAKTSPPSSRAMSPRSSKHKSLVQCILRCSRRQPSSLRATATNSIFLQPPAMNTSTLFPALSFPKRRCARRPPSSNGPCVL